MQRKFGTRCAATSFHALPLLALSLACERGQVDLGEGGVSQDYEQASRCADSTTLSAVIYVANQAELDALAGCEEIRELRIVPFLDIDLTPLASLQTVVDAFEIGAYPDPLPQDFEEQRVLLEPIFALNEAGWIHSLHGLESLESVGILYTTGTTITDFSELESLTTIRDGMVLRHAHNLVNLTGLEAARPPTVWIADASSLQSLEGLELRAHGQAVTVERVPALVNVDALEDIVAAETIVLAGTGLVTFPPLEQLISVNDLRIEGNPFLSDLDGLNNLQSVNSLNILYNPSLIRLPNFGQLSWLETLVVSGSDALGEVALNFPARRPQLRTIGTREVEYSTAYIEFSENPGLRRITSPAGFTAVQFFSAFQNQSLVGIDLGQLESANFLMLADNPALESVVAPSLAAVNTLEVVNNPLLSTAGFDSVETFSRQISGNAEPSAP